MSLSTATPETKSFPFFCSHLLTASCFPSWLHFLFEYCNWCCFNLVLLACMCSLFEIVPGLWALLEPPWLGVKVGEGSDPTEIFPCHIQSDWGVLQTADAFMRHLLGAGEGKRSVLVEWSLGGKVERRLGYTKAKYLAVSRFLLAVISVSGFQAAVQSQLLTVWVTACWCKKIISQSEVPPSLLHGIVSKKNKQKKCHWYLVSLKLWQTLQLSFWKALWSSISQENLKKHVKIIFCGLPGGMACYRWKCWLKGTELQNEQGLLYGCRHGVSPHVRMGTRWFILLIGMQREHQDTCRVTLQSQGSKPYKSSWCLW